MNLNSINCPLTSSSTFDFNKTVAEHSLHQEIEDSSSSIFTTSLSISPKIPETCLTAFNFSLYFDLRIGEEGWDESGDLGAFTSNAYRSIKDEQPILISQTMLLNKPSFISLLNTDRNPTIKLFRQINGGFLFILPESHLKNGLTGLGFKSGTFKEINLSELQDLLNQKLIPSATAKDFHQLWQINSGPEKRVFIHGHGYYATDQLDFGGKGEPNAIIAALEVSEYQQVLETLSLIKTQLALTDSCYSAGHNFIFHSRPKDTSGERPPLPFPICMICSDDNDSVGASGDKLFFNALDKEMNKYPSQTGVKAERLKSVWQSMNIIVTSSISLIYCESNRRHIQELDFDYLQERITPSFIQDHLTSETIILDYSIIYERPKKLLLYSSVIPLTLKLSKISQLISKIPGHAQHWIKKIILNSNLQDFIQKVTRLINDIPVNKSFFISSILLNTDEHLEKVCIDLSYDFYKLTYCLNGDYFALDSTSKLTSEPISEEVALIRMQEAYLKSSPFEEDISLATTEIETKHSICPLLEQEFWSSLKHFENSLLQAIESNEEKAIFLVKSLPQKTLNHLLGLLLFRKQIKLIKVAIQHGANIHQKIHAKQSILDLAIQLGDLPFVKWLVHHGANLKKNAKKNILDAIMHGSREIVFYILKQIPTLDLSENIYDLVKVAEMNHHYRLAEELKQNHLYQSLAEMLKGNNIEGIKQSIDIFSLEEKKTLFTLASYKGDETLIKLLINRGVDVNYSFGCYKQTALFLAVRDFNIPLMEFLINRGASLDHLDVCSRGILAYAAQSGFLAQVQFLVQNYPALMNQVESALEQAKKDEFISIVDYLTQIKQGHS